MEKDSWEERSFFDLISKRVYESVLCRLHNTDSTCCSDRVIVVIAIIKIRKILRKRKKKKALGAYYCWMPDVNVSTMTRRWRGSVTVLENLKFISHMPGPVVLYCLWKAVAWRLGFGFSRTQAGPKPPWSRQHGLARLGLFGLGSAWLTASGRALHSTQCSLVWCETPKQHHFCAVAKLVEKKIKISLVKSTFRQQHWDFLGMTNCVFRPSARRNTHPTDSHRCVPDHVAAAFD